jgi:hypothetical protein
MKIEWSLASFGALTRELWPRKDLGALWDSLVVRARDCLAAKAWNMAVGDIPKQNVRLGSSLMHGTRGVYQIPQHIQ